MKRKCEYDKVREFKTSFPKAQMPRALLNADCKEMIYSLFMPGNGMCPLDTRQLLIIQHFLDQHLRLLDKYLFPYLAHSLVYAMGKQLLKS